jgi:hypothetical protein
LNKAKAAYDQYRQRMPGPAGGGGFPALGPFPVFPPPGSGMAPGSPQPPAGLSFGAANTVPLAESVGQMLRLGVAFATATLAGGLQVMQGFAGPAYAPPQRPMGGCGCGDRCEDEYSGCGCGCSCGGDYCQDSVHNCRCGGDGGCGCC